MSNHFLKFITFVLIYTLRKSLQTTSALFATSKQCFEQPAASLLFDFH
ncbi:hypothetical protein SK629_1249 [Streptococcus mitis]|uniref:Uncharacterized protein n=1 Tax=Streptococcus mitis TaxID=28037 RepID=A0A081PV98_STRMT|nr:hypothetical protein SK629_1249 [Streptococcus mitis]